jgi:hypothetical protein
MPFSFFNRKTKATQSVAPDNSKWEWNTASPWERKTATTPLQDAHAAIARQDAVKARSEKPPTDWNW